MASQHVTTSWKKTKYWEKTCNTSQRLNDENAGIYKLVASQNEDFSQQNKEKLKYQMY